MFSIIVPSYNRKAEIPNLLASLMQQTLHNFEVIIVDDCSKEAVENFEQYPFDVTILRNEKNQGAAQSRNIGVAQARYEWLLFLDDDDRFLPNKCEVLAKTIEQNPELNFIYHPAECRMVNEGFTYFTRPHYDTKLLTLDNMLLVNKIGGMPMLAVKKSLFEEVGGLSAELYSLEDYDFILKLVSSPNFNAQYVDQALTRCVFYTKRASVSTNLSNIEKAIEQIESKFVKTPLQQQNFALNRLYMLVYPNIMNLSRKAAWYYWQMFKLNKNIKMLIIALVILISPVLAINMKRFF